MLTTLLSDQPPSPPNFPKWTPLLKARFLLEIILGLYGLLSLLYLELHSKYILNWKACKAYVYPIYVVKGFDPRGMPWLSALNMMDGSSDSPGGMWMDNKVRIM